MATVTFLEPGTDATQDLSLFAGTAILSGSIASDSSTSVTGSRSMKTITTANGGTQSSQCWSPDNTVADAGTRCSFRVRFSSVALSDQNCVLFPATSGGPANGAFGVVLNTNGTLALFGVAQKNGTTVLSANTWYRLALSYVITGTTTYTAKLFLNGVLEITMTGTDGAIYTTATSVMVFGSSAAFIPGAGASATVWYDDLYIDNGTTLDDPGDIHVTNKRAFTNGTTNGFTTQIGAGGSGYGSGHAPQVNEQPLSQTNGWSVLVVASAITEEYNIEGLSVGDVNLTGTTITGVMGWIFCKSSLTETDQIIVDGTATNITVTSTAAAFMQVSPNPTTYPASTGTDIGMKTNMTAATASLYECGILIAYLAAATITVAQEVPAFTAFVSEQTRGEQWI